ncbi:MAG: hypothetical protein HY059_15530 [Proteobacteria bacterium]|nr:hypothetical protein [Pseudomonadota bacterium]
MKIKVDVECTPEEARVFMGLPDVKPMQEALMGQMTGRLESAMKAMEPEAILRQWFTGAGWDQMQKFWSLGADHNKTK